MNSFEKTYLKLKEQELDELLNKIPNNGVEIKKILLKGVPFIEAIKEVLRNNVDLIIKPVSAKHSFPDMLFGSDDMHLLRKCPCPVWLVKSSKRKTYSRILAAVDIDPGEKENAELNKLILELATSLALQENSELHIVHVWQLLYESMLRNGRARIPASEVDKMVRDGRKLHKKSFADLLNQHDLGQLKYKSHLLKGEPDDVIPALAKKKKAELIIMGTVARTGIPGFFIGNTAEKILARVDSSVLAVKPGSFITPVQ